MNPDNALERPTRPRPAGTVEQANRATVAKEPFQTPEPAPPSTDPGSVTIPKSSVTFADMSMELGADCSVASGDSPRH